MSNPDFLQHHLETNRFRIEQDVDSHRYQTRLLEKKKAFWSETIQLRLLHHQPTSASTPLVSNWKVPRFRLSKEFVEDCCNRAWVSHVKANSTHAPAGNQPTRLALSDESGGDKAPTIIPLMLSHLHHRESNTVIIPSDLQSQCKVDTIYDVIVLSAGGISAGGLLACSAGFRRKHLEQQLGASGVQAHYDGSLCFVLHDVPTTSRNKQWIVTQDDIRRWIVDGCTSDDDSMTLPGKRVVNLEQTLSKLEKEHRGLVATDSPEESVAFVQDEMKRTKAQLENAKLTLDSARAKHFDDCSLSITLLPMKDPKESDEVTTASWKVKVRGKKKEQYQKLIEKNKKWCLTTMYGTGDPELTKHKSKAKSKQNAAVDFAMTIAKSEQMNHYVDVRNVRIEKLPDGFGVYESFVTSCISRVNTDDADGRHSLYHGRFFEGAMHGEGTLYTDEGVYSGLFQFDERVGKGTLEYSDGITLSGDFALPTRSKGESQCESEDEMHAPLGPNPYSRGIPHGNVNIQFANGDEYEGEMRNGSVTGKGVYRYALQIPGLQKQKGREPKKYLREVHGEWIDGTLQNNDGIEGQGYSNLLRSLMFGGERLWNP